MLKQSREGFRLVVFQPLFSLSLTSSLSLSHTHTHTYFRAFAQSLGPWWNEKQLSPGSLASPYRFPASLPLTVTRERHVSERNHPYNCRLRRVRSRYGVASRYAAWARVNLRMKSKGDMPWHSPSLKKTRRARAKAFTENFRSWEKCPTEIRKGGKMLEWIAGRSKGEGWRAGKTDEILEPQRERVYRL